MADNRKLLSEVSKQLTLEDLEFLESSESKSELEFNAMLVLFKQHRRQLVWFMSAYEVLNRSGEQEFRELLKNGSKDTTSAEFSESLRKCESASAARDVASMIASFFRWFASVASLDECHRASVAVEVKPPAEAYDESTAAIAAIDRFIERYANEKLFVENCEAPPEGTEFTCLSEATGVNGRLARFLASQAGRVLTFKEIADATDPLTEQLVWPGDKTVGAGAIRKRVNSVSKTYELGWKASEADQLARKKM